MTQTGFGRVDVTPPVGRPLGRLFRNDMIAETVEWPLYASCMAVENGTARVLVFSLDKNRLLDPTVAAIRDAVAAATGVPATHQFIACTHAHNVPFATNWLPGDDSGLEYLGVLKRAFCRAADEALAGLRPARLHIARASAPGLNVNRRSVYRTDDGEQVGTHGPTDHPDFLRAEGPADDEVLALAAEDCDGRTLGGVVNFACHPTTMYSATAWSADYPGALAAALSRDPGGVFLFLNGAAGNLSPNPALGKGGDGVERARLLGETLAQCVLRALPTRREIEACPVSVRSRRLRIPQRRPTGDQIELARGYIEDGVPSDLRAFCRRLYGYTHTMYNAGERLHEWLCRELLGMWEWQRRAAQPEPADEVDVRVVRLGDFALVGFPSEIFCEFGLEVKRASPLPDTMVAELANGWHGYIPTKDGFARGGYETSFAYQSRLVPEAGDRMCAAALELLAEVTAEG